jgi:hypothetical protein
MHLESRLLTGFSQCPDEILPVDIVLEYLLAPIPTAHDVVNRSRKLHSQLARHGRTLRFPSSPIKTMLWLTPASTPSPSRPLHAFTVGCVEQARDFLVTVGVRQPLLINL